MTSMYLTIFWLCKFCGKYCAILFVEKHIMNKWTDKWSYFLIVHMGTIMVNDINPHRITQYETHL